MTDPPAEAIQGEAFDALAAWIAGRPPAAVGPLVIGLAGAQGSGKSTLATALTRALSRRYGLRSAVLSLDDLYRTRAERTQLAAAVHPLLRTRGVPGTHDVALGLHVLAELRTATHVRLPRFDKARDDRTPEAAWPEVATPLDVLLFEGWCVGARPEPEAALVSPVNSLEHDEDADGRFRRYVNEQLAGPYQPLFESLDALVFLEVPDLGCSLAWRLEQERSLRAGGDGCMSDAEVGRFVQFFERISRHMLAEMPGRADVVVVLDRGHSYTRIALRLE